MREAREIERKLPVWHALSEFYLDTELQARDYEEIAHRLSASGFTPTQLRAILEQEVAPAFAFNLLDVAGEWLSWREDEVREIMVRSDGSLPPMRWLKRRMFRRYLQEQWDRIAPLLEREYSRCSDSLGDDQG
jgi:hypothetical protein